MVSRTHVSIVLPFGLFQRSHSPANAKMSRSGRWKIWLSNFQRLRAFRFIKAVGRHQAPAMLERLAKRRLRLHCLRHSVNRRGGGLNFAPERNKPPRGQAECSVLRFVLPYDRNWRCRPNAEIRHEPRLAEFFELVLIDQLYKLARFPKCVATAHDRDAKTHLRTEQSLRLRTGNEVTPPLLIIIIFVVIRIVRIHQVSLGY